MAHARAHPAIAGAWATCGCAARVLPDGCADVVWVHGELHVVGPATRAELVPASPAGERPFGVRLRVGAVEAGLGLPAWHLRDVTVPADELWGRPARNRVARAAAGGPRDGARALLAEIESVASRTGVDALVREATRRLTAPAARLPAVAGELELGERQLRRRFDRAVGYGPRTLIRVLRLQRTLAIGRRAPRLTLAALAASAGYADQPHLSRETRLLTGLSPADLVASGAGPQGETATGTFTTCGRPEHRLDP